MGKIPLIGVSICAVVLLVLGSLSNVVGYQTVQTSQQNIIKERINQKELLFQTIVDIVNNKEIQQIILKSQINRGIFPVSDIPVVTKPQLKQMYLVGLMLSKVISKSRIHSMVEPYQVSHQEMQKEITAAIEKDATLNGEINQLSSLKCDCGNENTTQWSFPVLCTVLFFILYPLLLFGDSLWLFGAYILTYQNINDIIWLIGAIAFTIGIFMVVLSVGVSAKLHCWWSPY